MPVQRSTTFQITNGLLTTSVTITEVYNSETGFMDLMFTLDVDEGNGTTGDLRALFFDFADDANVENLTVSGENITGFTYDEDAIDSLGKDANIKGKIAKDLGKFDAGVGFGTPGKSKDDIQSTTFTISSDSMDLSLDFLELQDFGLTVKSVGDVDGKRSGSEKIAGQAPEVPATNDFYGTDGNDNLVGTDFDDTLFGNGGDDILFGGLGDDTLTGGEGSDVFVYTSLDEIPANTDIITDLEPGGVDQIDMSAIGGLFFVGDTQLGLNIPGETWYELNLDNTTSIYVDGDGDGTADSHILINNGQFDIVETVRGSMILMGRITFEGTGGDDNLIGTEFPDIIYGYEGDDTLTALGGEDFLYGGEDNDTLIGGAGADHMYGEDGNDILLGGAGNDALHGGAGGDVLDGGEGDWDWAFYQGATTDIIANLTDASENTGDAQGDSYIGIENLSGSNFNDTLTGDAGENNIQGLSGDDILSGGEGDDSLTGGEGNDTYILQPGGGIDTIWGFNAGAGTDDVLDLGAYTNILSMEDLNIIENGAGNTVINFGNGDVVTLRGVSLADLHEDDFIFIPNLFTENEDVIDFNSITIGTYLDGTQYDALGGNDTVYLPDDEVAALAAGYDLSQIFYAGSGDDIIVGSLGNDVLDGGSGVNTMDGGEGGDDYIWTWGIGGVLDISDTGTNGIDRIKVNAGNYDINETENNIEFTGLMETFSASVTGIEHLVFDAGAGVPVNWILQGSDGSAENWDFSGVLFDLSGGSYEIYTGDGEDNIIDSFADTTIDGGAGNDVINGWYGNDTLIGGTGNDTLLGGEGDDVLDGGSGTNIMDGGEGSDDYIWTWGIGGVLDISDTGTNGIDRIIVNSGNYDINETENNIEFTGLTETFSASDTGIERLYFDAGADVGVNWILQGSDNSSENWDFSGVLFELSGMDSYEIYTGDGEDIIIDSFADTTIDGGAGNDVINGWYGNDTLIGGAGSDSLTGGTEADHMWGGSELDTFILDAGDSELSFSGIGDNGTVSGFDTIYDFDPGNGTFNSETFDTVGSASVASDTAGTDGADSTLTIAGSTIKSHSIVDGIITFDDADTFADGLLISTNSEIAAVLDYLQNQDLGDAGTTVSFDVGVDAFVFTQGDDAGTDDLDVVVRLEGAQVDNLITTNGTGEYDLFIV